MKNMKNKLVKDLRMKIDELTNILNSNISSNNLSLEEYYFLMEMFRICNQKIYEFEVNFNERS